MNKETLDLVRGRKPATLAEPKTLLDEFAIVAWPQMAAILARESNYSHEGAAESAYAAARAMMQARKP